MKYIYAIHYCDQWKSNASMRLQVVTTSVRRFIRELKLMIKRGDCFKGEHEEFRVQ